MYELYFICDSYIYSYRIVKDIGGKKNFDKFGNLQQFAEFLPIFTIFITFPMQTDFSSSKFFLQTSYSPYLPNAFNHQRFLLYGIHISGNTCITKWCYYSIMPYLFITNRYMWSLLDHNLVAMTCMRFMQILIPPS